MKECSLLTIKECGVREGTNYRELAVMESYGLAMSMVESTITNNIIIHTLFLMQVHVHVYVRTLYSNMIICLSAFLKRPHYYWDISIGSEVKVHRVRYNGQKILSTYIHKCKTIPAIKSVHTRTELINGENKAEN